MDTIKKQKSREYPAISLPKAVEMARRVYDKDRWVEAPALTAVKHMGYAGLNGGSRPVLSALKKYGLVEYLGSSDNMRVKLTDLAKRILLPASEAERAEAVREAMNAPVIHGELLEAFPNWDLPSDETLSARLEREFGLQNAAVKSFVSDLRDSLEYVGSFRQSRLNVVHDDRPGANQNLGAGNDAGEAVDAGMMKLPMPRSSTFIVMPQVLDALEARRILSWLSRVVTPAVKFASESEDIAEEIRA